MRYNLTMITSKRKRQLKNIGDGIVVKDKKHLAQILNVSEGSAKTTVYVLNKTGLIKKHTHLSLTNKGRQLIKKKD